MNDVEKTRESFKPDCITTLFVGESRPSGGTFFYNLDNPSNLLRAMKRAFETALGEPFENNGDFLNHFEACGFYLDDLALEPINHLGKTFRNEMREKGIKPLSDRIRRYDPQRIVIVMCAIKDEVRESMRMACFTGEWDCVAFPANGNQRRFHNEMLTIIPELPCSGARKRRKKTK
jgi:hypothetical protein